jgi:hypothetical protein
MMDDAEIDALIARADEDRKRRERVAEPDAMLKTVQLALAKAEKAHRLANEVVEIRTFDVTA